MKTVTVAGVELTLPAFIVLVAGLAVTLIETLILASLLRRTLPSAKILMFSLFNMVILFLVLALNVYIINCLSVGGCDVLAVIFTSLYLLAIIVSILSAAAGKRAKRSGSKRSSKARLV